MMVIAQELSKDNSFAPPFNKYGWSGNNLYQSIIPRKQKN